MKGATAWGEREKVYGIFNNNTISMSGGGGIKGEILIEIKSEQAPTMC